MNAPAHISVLLAEVVQALGAAPGETILDGTFGAGGYSRAILATGASVVAFDRDPSVARFAEGLPADRFRLIQDRFSQMAEHFGPQSVDGVVLDIGVSSMQIDEAERGFSFMRDGPLDMRMDTTRGISAAEWL
ncbi:MAG: 16S rRNA (cytosine(1402)-N(4))-methyltransferase, partial [bacterium]|nr:16S rRNA (cytosine(1402)-N(4))-methyltransferase [bacterium]